jgi:RNA polymerase sigma-70 factor (ECF subfamily)
MMPAALPLAAVEPVSRAEPGAAKDAELMARVGGGDRQAFGELVERHKDHLLTYLCRLTGSRDRADDLAQETFLRLFHAARSYRERGRLGAFLVSIATNLVRSEERRARRWRLLTAAFAPEGRPLPAPSPAAEPAGDERLLSDERRRHLAAALARLPLPLRVPLVLAEVEGWPLKDVARQLGCREGTVKSRLFRARRRLRAELAPVLAGGSP